MINLFIYKANIDSLSATSSGGLPVKINMKSSNGGVVIIVKALCNSLVK